MQLPSICWTLLRSSVRSEMQYRANFLIEVLFGLVYQTIGFAFLWVVVGQFNAIGGWSLPEVTLLYGIQLAGYALWALSFSRIMLIEDLVKGGEYDRMLIRPIPMVLQFMFGGFRIATLGDVLGAIVLLTIGLQSSNIEWSFAKVVFLVAAVMSSGMIRGAFDLATSSLVFRFLGSGHARWLVENIFGVGAGYPMDIFERSVRSFLTFIVPVSFIAWVPGSVLLDRTDALPFPEWIAWGSPLIGPVLIVAAWWLFIRESRQYQSSGS